MVAPSIVTTSASQHSGAASHTKSFTIAANSNRKLLVGFVEDTATTVFTNVEWGGVALTEIAIAGLDNIGASLWELVNPAAGTADITWDSVSTTAHVCAALDTRDAEQDATDPADTNAGSSAVSSAQSLSLTAVTDALLIDVLATESSSQTLTEAGDGTQIANQVATGIATAGLSAYTAVAPGSVTLGWTSSGLTKFAQVMVMIRPVAATEPVYDQTKFRLYNDDGTGLGEAP